MFALVQGCAYFGLPAPAFQLRRDDARIIKHQTIAGMKQTGQITDNFVAQLIAHDMQQPRTVARRRRAQGNQVRRKLKIK